MLFLDYLIKHGDLKQVQREVFIEYMDTQLKELLEQTNVISKGRIDYRWGEYLNQKKSMEKAVYNV